MVSVVTCRHHVGRRGECCVRFALPQEGGGLSVGGSWSTRSLLPPTSAFLGRLMALARPSKWGDGRSAYEDQYALMAGRWSTAISTFSSALCVARCQANIQRAKKPGSSTSMQIDDLVKLAQICEQHARDATSPTARVELTRMANEYRQRAVQSERQRASEDRYGWLKVECRQRPGL